MKPLNGIRILDLSRLLPGPYCTMLLADLGAEVIKIESPGLGDYIRVVPPFIKDSVTGEPLSTAFLVLNRNKKSIALNYRNKRGKEVFLRLVRDADVVLESFRAGAAEKWGLGYEALRAINPRIVYCSLSGYGQTGPYKERAGHDLNYLALSGLLATNGVAGGPPIPPGAQIADLSGGMMAAIAILSALIGRGKTGAGQYLDVSLFEGALSWAGTMIGGAFAGGVPIERGAMQLNGGMACYNVYGTSDGQYLTLAAIEPHFWGAFCKAVGRDDLSARAQELAAVSEVAAIFKTRTRDEWLALFAALDVCVEPVRGFSEVFDDPHVKHRGLIANIDGVPQIGSVFVFADNAHAPPPRLGENTREELSRIGLTTEEIGELEKAGVVKTLG
jgi:alpha-methylacyl-CoA racemase